jgi:hypothetical protein
MQDTRYSGREFRFELWSNGLFHGAAANWLSMQNCDFESYTVGWKDGAALKRYAGNAKSGGISKILNEHYFLHPLAAQATQQTESSQA